ncbi:MAG: hypothetical protein KA297_11635 [Kofleriaceae bacterium]|nr:hypothetical protein [Kofleriaceae bacterium]
MRIPIWFVVLAACGPARGGDPDAANDESPLVAAVSVRPVGSLDPAARGYAIAALDERRLAIARLDQAGDAFCPDCVGLSPDECPAQCDRTSVSVAVLDVATRAWDTAHPVAVEFPASFDHDVGQVEVVALDDDRVGVGWLACDNGACGGAFAKRSCAARYTTIDLSSGVVGPVQTLYADRFGDLHLAFDPELRALLAVTGSSLAVSAGLYRAIFDETGAAVRSPWAPLGSPAARSPAVLAHDGDFLVVADDWSPRRPPRGAPCGVSCDCLEAGEVEPDEGGLYAFTVDGAGVDDDRVERIAAGVDTDGFYGRRERLAAIAAGGAPLVAGTQSIDRHAELFIRDASGWSRRMRVAAPVPTWIGALGTGQRQAWIGAQPEPGQASLAQRLVVGAIDATREERATISAPERRSVLAIAPVASAQGVTTTFLLSGRYPDDGGNTWAGLDLLELDAAW